MGMALVMGEKRVTGSCYLTRHFAVNGGQAGEYELWTPSRFAEGQLRYGVFRFQKSAGEVTRLRGIYEGAPGRFVSHGASVQGGEWTTLASLQARGGSLARSHASGATLQMEMRGRMLALVGARGPLGGFALVSVDGDAQGAHGLPTVAERDIRAMSGVTAGAGGSCRVRCVDHGFAHGAVIRISETGYAGLTGVWEAAVVDGDHYDCVGSVYVGDYLGPGWAGYFAKSDVGKCYMDFHGMGSEAFDVQTLLTRDLTDDVHQVRLTVQGTSRGSGMSGRYVYVAGIMASSANDVAETAGSVMLIDGCVQEGFAGEDALEAGHGALFQEEGAGSATWYGEAFGKEQEGATQWLVDGRPVPLQAGERKSGEEIRLRCERSLLTENLDGELARRSVEFATTAMGPASLVRRDRIVWNAPGRLHAYALGGIALRSEGAGKTWDGWHRKDGLRLNNRDRHKASRLIYAREDGRPMVGLFDATGRGASVERPLEDGGLAVGFVEEFGGGGKSVVRGDAYAAEVGWHVSRRGLAEGGALVAAAWMRGQPGCCYEEVCFNSPFVFHEVPRDYRPEFRARLVKRERADEGIERLDVEAICFHVVELAGEGLEAREAFQDAAHREDRYVGGGLLKEMRRDKDDGNRAYNFVWQPAQGLGLRAGVRYAAAFTLYLRDGGEEMWRHGLRGSLQ